MSDHPVLIPTSIGPIGGMVSEPDGERRAAAILSAGVGGERFGVNQLWTSLARDLASEGLVTLRPDYPGGKGDSLMAAKDARPAPFMEVVSWFRQRTPGLDLLLLGSCYGARLAVSVGVQEQDVLGVAFITPTFVRWKRRGDRGEQESLVSRAKRKIKKKVGQVAPLPLDPRFGEAVTVALERMPVWAIVGERDHRCRTDVFKLREMLPETSRDGLVIEEVPGFILHTQPSLEGQRTTRERVVDWASRLLDQEVAVR
ncbi:MAG TPA: hypothetical protein VKA30_11655 [Actinomycetota bacterium]|nr:hypothetical protein [Actinomycetota bacterium]